MNKCFLPSTVILVLLINEITLHAALAVTVGEYSIAEAVQRALRGYSVMSFLFSSAIRAVPFIILWWCYTYTDLKTSIDGRLALWGALVVISIYHAYGYWSFQYSLYTPAHTSSTSSLAIIFIPFYALFYGVLSGAIMFGFGFCCRKLAKL